MDERGEFISIAEAATLLGVHRNTIRNCIKGGRYKAHKVVTPRSRLTL
jgi:excisionase family DNA binding protein